MSDWVRLLSREHALLMATRMGKAPVNTVSKTLLYLLEGDVIGDEPGVRVLLARLQEEWGKVDKEDLVKLRKAMERKPSRLGAALRWMVVKKETSSMHKTLIKVDLLEKDRHAFLEAPIYRLVYDQEWVSSLTFDQCIHLYNLLKSRTFPVAKTTAYRLILGTIVTRYLHTCPAYLLDPILVDAKVMTDELAYAYTAGHKSHDIQKLLAVFRSGRHWVLRPVVHEIVSRRIKTEDITMEVLECMWEVVRSGGRFEDAEMRTAWKVVIGGMGGKGGVAGIEVLMVACLKLAGEAAFRKELDMVLDIIDASLFIPPTIDIAAQAVFLSALRPKTPLFTSTYSYLTEYALSRDDLTPSTLSIILTHIPPTAQLYMYLLASHAGVLSVAEAASMGVTGPVLDVVLHRIVSGFMSEPCAKRQKMENGNGKKSLVGKEVMEKLSQLQAGLNKRISENWENERKMDDWGLAITLECAELIDSYPWKWWKNVKGKVDLNNVKIELVDILHFSLSGQMQSTVEDDVSSSIVTPLTETQNAITTFRHIINLTNSYSFMTITRHIIESAADLDFNIVSYYIAKHTLNYIRQLGGYKDGTYKKVREGIEDNELLHECIEGITLADISADFEKISNAIMTKVYDVFQVDAEHRRTVASWL